MNSPEIESKRRVSIKELPIEVGYSPISNQCYRKKCQASVVVVIGTIISVAIFATMAIFSMAAAVKGNVGLIATFNEAWPTLLLAGIASGLGPRAYLRSEISGASRELAEYFNVYDWVPTQDRKLMIDFYDGSYHLCLTGVGVAQEDAKES